MSELLKRLENLSPNRLALAVLELEERLRNIERSRREPIAVVGIGCRFPGGANGPDELWRFLESGGDAISEVPPERWDADAFYDPDPDAPGKCSTRLGGFLSAVDLFDAAHFGISPREAARMDPQQRLLLEVSWEALEHAAVAPDRVAGSNTGVYLGLSTSDYFNVIRAAGLEETDGHSATGNAHSVAAGRISYTLGLQGPAVAVDTACSSSLVAVHLACRALRAGDCDLALAGGVNVMLAPQVSIALSRAHMLAPDGRSKAFDAAANGFVRSEGCGIVVLKRLSDALAAGDRILAVVRGSAVNQDGRSNGITAPNGLAQEQLIRRALADSGVEPSQVGYIEAHGTGTALGDPIEAHALASVFSGMPRRLWLGSVKTNLGHLEAAAGVAGFIKTVLALEHGRIPPHLHFTRLNPHIDFERAPVAIPADGVDWTRGAQPRIAGVSSFGFCGTNAHVVLEEAPEVLPRASFSAGPWRLALAARTGSALRELAGRYETFLRDHPKVDLADVCYTASRGRARLSQCAVIEAATRIQMIERLSEISRNGAERAEMPAGAPPAARVVTLPTYPFERTRHWLDVSAPPAAAARTNERPGVAPDYYEVAWRQQDAQEPASSSRVAESAREILCSAAAAVTIERFERFSAALDRASLGFVLQAFAPLGAPANSAELIARIGITPRYHRLVDHLLRVLGPDDDARAAGSPGGQIRQLAAGFPEYRGWIELVDRCGSALPQVLTGKRDPLELLFPEASFETALDIYEGSPAAKLLQQSLAALLAEAARAAGRKIRVLEIGAGTGGTTTFVVQAIAGYCSEYVFTDVSPIFTARAEERFRAYSFLRYRVLDIERPPEAQGFEPGTFDLVIAANVLHATSDLRRSLDHAASLLADGGRVVLLESTAPVASIDITFGLTEGWWHFRDTGLRQDYPLLSRDRWLSFLEEQGFEDAAAVPVDGRLPQAILTATARSKGGKANRRFLIVGGEREFAEALASGIERAGAAANVVSETEEFKAGTRGIVYLGRRHAQSPYEIAPGAIERALDIAHIVREASAAAGSPRLWVVTSGAQAVEGQVTNPGAACDWGFGRTIAIEHPSIWGGLVDLDPAATREEQVRQLAQELLRGDSEDQIAFRHGRRWVPRLVRTEAPAANEPRFDPNASYLITGGLGGLGLKVARWMADNGARRLVLVSRGSPGRAGQADAIEELRGRGVHVEIAVADVTDRGAMERLFDRFGNSAPPLKGVLHMAAELGRDEIAQMTAEALGRVMAPKVAGAAILDELTRASQLDFFCLFSSTGSLVGSRTMAHYAAANAFLDAIASARRAACLPAVAIGWGTWDEMRSARDEDRRRYRQIGFLPMASESALEALGRLLAPQAPAHRIVAAVDWRIFKPAIESRRKQPLLASVGDEPGVPREIRAAFSSPGPAPEEPLREYLARQVHEVLELPAEQQLGDDAELFALGLDSLASVELKNRLERALGLSIPSTVLLQYPTLGSLSEFLERDLQSRKAIAVPPARSASSAATDYALSSGQRSIWFIHSLDPRSAAYNCTVAAQVHPAPDADCLKQALRMVVDRHELLRVSIRERDGEPHWRVHPAVEPQLRRVSLAGLGEGELQERILVEAERPFDPTSAPLARLALIENGPAGSTLVLTAHHIIFDARSSEVFLTDLARAYDAVRAGTMPDWPPLRTTFRDFVAEESIWLAGPEAREAWQYWQAQLRGLPGLRFPNERPGASDFDMDGASIPFRITAELAERIAGLAAARKTTTFTLLLAAWQAVLQAWTSQPDLAVAVPVSRRDDRRFTSAIGSFMNIVLMRSRSTPHASFDEHLANTRTTVLEGLRYKDFPFGQLVERLGFTRNAGALQEVRTAFNLLRPLSKSEAGSSGGSVELGGWRLTPITVPQQEGHYDLTLALWEAPSGFQGWIKYRPTVIHGPAAADLAAQLRHLLVAAVANPGEPVVDLMSRALTVAGAREELEW